jgi:hypothetical protein
MRLELELWPLERMGLNTEMHALIATCLDGNALQNMRLDNAA